MNEKKKGDRIPAENPFVSRELYSTAISLHKLEVAGFSAIAAVIGFFTAGILFSAFPPLIGAGYMAVAVLITWGVMQAALARRLYQAKKVIG